MDLCQAPNRFENNDSIAPQARTESMHIAEQGCLKYVFSKAFEDESSIHVKPSTLPVSIAQVMYMQDDFQEPNHHHSQEQGFAGAQMSERVGQLTSPSLATRNGWTSQLETHLCSVQNAAQILLRDHDDVHEVHCEGSGTNRLDCALE